jgi:signal-transduction protein with cAMP-binding, CBS, and nucleotidyltransferase domain
VDSLALYHGIFDGTTTWDKIEHLGRKVLSLKGAKNLVHCMNLLCAMKLKLHAFYKEEGTEIYFERYWCYTASESILPNTVNVEK